MDISAFRSSAILQSCLKRRHISGLDGFTSIAHHICNADTYEILSWYGTLQISPERPAAWHLRSDIDL